MYYKVSVSPSLVRYCIHFSVNLIKRSLMVSENKWAVLYCYRSTAHLFSETTCSCQNATCCIWVKPYPFLMDMTYSIQFNMGTKYRYISFFKLLPQHKFHKRAAYGWWLTKFECNSWYTLSSKYVPISSHVHIFAFQSITIYKTKALLFQGFENLFSLKIKPLILGPEFSFRSENHWTYSTVECTVDKCTFF